MQKSEYGSKIRQRVLFLSTTLRLRHALNRLMPRTELVCTRQLGRLYGPTRQAGDQRKRIPNIVEVAVGGGPLEAKLNHRMMLFHNSRGIGLRHGRIINRNDQAYYRWCFPDLATAQAFAEQFGGEIL